MSLREHLYKVGAIITVSALGYLIGAGIAEINYSKGLQEGINSRKEEQRPAPNSELCGAKFQFAPYIISNNSLEEVLKEI